MLAFLAVVFGGIVGNGNPEADRISTEIVAAVREKVEVTPITLPVKQLAALTHHASGSREIVAKLHVDGLIGGELIDKGGTLTLRLVVYAADGGLRSLSEITLRNRALAFDDFGVIRSNLTDEIRALTPKAAKPVPVPVVIEKAPVPKPVPLAPPVEKAAVPAPAKVTKAIKVVPAPAPEIEMEAEPAAAPVTEPAASEEPVPGIDEPAGISQSAIPDDSEDADPVLGLQLGVGLGVVSRSFAPGPAIAGYSASPVGTIGVTARIQPARKLCLDALVDRTLAMSTPMGMDSAATTMSRWEVSADYTLHAGRVSVASRLGLGRRAFSIESNLSSRTPDSDYNYLIVGATASASLGHGILLRGLAAFEPVLWGREPTEMALGEARRWAIDVGAAIELHPTAHVFARVAADLQRFAWTWDSAGARGSGGAVDLFPSAMASLGASY